MAKINSNDIEKGLGRYTVHYTYEDGWWLVEVDGEEVSGIRSEARTIEQARANIRDALSLAVDDAFKAELDEKFPDEFSELATAFAAARTQAAQAEARALEAGRSAVAALERRKVSTRDASAILGVSQSRVSQLVRAAKERPASKAAPTKGRVFVEDGALHVKGGLRVEGGRLVRTAGKKAKPTKKAAAKR